MHISVESIMLISVAVGMAATCWGGLGYWRWQRKLRGLT
ncbi:Uncharacterised protein [uncultured archaeon]|nr:Uncharacterised protein [uncultured archaeon]